MEQRDRFTPSERIQEVHKATLGKIQIAEVVRKDFYISSLNNAIEAVSQRCTCAKVKQSTRGLPEGHRLREPFPELDCVELKSGVSTRQA